MWVRLAWSKITLAFTVAAATGSSVHEAVGYILVLIGAGLAGALTAGVCLVSHAPAYLTVSAFLLIFAGVTVLGVWQINRRSPRVRRHRSRRS
jgi:FtsH-binding integral membrane protein